MSKTLNLTLACALLGSLASFGAQALPISSLGSQVEAQVTFVAGGCGPGFHPDAFGRCRPNRGDVVVVPGGPVVVAPAAPVVVAPAAPVVVAPPVVCGAGLRWHPRFRRCVIL
jgi:hypothetical protein